jgi:hypothetical protein
MAEGVSSLADREPAAPSGEVPRPSSYSRVEDSLRSVGQTVVEKPMGTVNGFQPQAALSAR